MPERILVGVAWPYANGPIHQGQMAGAYLPPDIFARYHRTAGNHVLMVSGSDSHGTPITVRAERENRTPEEVVAEFHKSFLDTWERMGISFDLFTGTDTPNHARVAQDFFLRLIEHGYLDEGTQTLPYCETDRRFLLDRYVEGTCPHCGFDGARGDQCDNCGRTLDPLDLINPRCRFCGNAPALRESKHFFLRFSKLQEPLVVWLSTDKEHWRRPVLNFSLSEIRQGIPDRAMTRDIAWGIPVPVEGYEYKRIYVWFEAVIGYLSASIEWAERQGSPDAWKLWWEDPEAKSYYFIGKDNITFHTIIWPGLLIAYGGLNLPFDVPANQYVNIGGSKTSTSRNWAVWIPDYLSRYDPDPLRYYLAATMPETSDSEFTWAEYVRRNNDELVATWGNLVNRTLTFTYRNFDGRIPEPGELTDHDRAILARAEETLAQVGEHIRWCRFRAGLNAAMELAREANAYLEQTAPWKSIKDDRPAAGRALYTAIGVIGALRTAFYPYLPFTCRKLDTLIGGDGEIEARGWSFALPVAGGALARPEPLFKKLDESIIEEEEGRLGT
ncbi:MAG: methionine--tRNA ligase [Chloroflexi bacterium]|nr:methionine--tRNA ligase [Chloroflexota bacterium]